MRRARLAALLAVVLAGPATVRAAEDARPPPPPPGFEMESVQLVLLLRAPTWKKLPAEESAALQKQHMAHLTAMGESGKMVVAGPFADQADPAYRGVCIYRVGSVAEARSLAEQDPIVKAGQLRVEAMTWWFGKGYMTFPKAAEKAPETPAERKAAP
jgi:uncharacterized protein YciI